MQIAWVDRRCQDTDANLSSTWLGDRTCFQTKDVGRLTDRVRAEGLHDCHRLHSSFEFSTAPNWLLRAERRGAPECGGTLFRFGCVEDDKKDGEHAEAR